MEIILQCGLYYLSFGFCTHHFLKYFYDSHFEYYFDILNMRAAHCVSHHFLRLCLYNYNTCVCVWFSLFLDRERLFDLPSFKFACLHFPSTF